ncbi:hypothetical protein KKB69_02715, partial [Patescibacteria group bacterium]|nr:hypothetical protein [Patescibacteria group bacterium]
MAKKIVLIILVVLVVAFLAYFAFFRGGEKSLPKTDMEGFLLLTLKPRTDNAVSGVYIYNLENRELKFFDDKNAVNITGHGLPGGDGITSSLLFDSLGEKNNEVFQLYRIAMQKNFEKRQITDSYTFFKRNPEWSPNGEKIVFMARKDIAGEPVSFSPDDWLVYMTGLAGQEKLLGKGAYPQWAP